jgi:hypothetical protein
MLDVIFSIAIVAFFVTALGYLRFCEGLQKKENESK